MALSAMLSVGCDQNTWEAGCDIFGLCETLIHMEEELAGCDKFSLRAPIWYRLPADRASLECWILTWKTVLVSAVAMLPEADDTKAPDREDGLIMLNLRILQLERNQKFSGEN